MRTRRIVPILAALGLVLLTLLEGRQSRATLREHRDACARFAREHGRDAASLCTDANVPAALPRYTKARERLAREGLSAVPWALGEAEALDRQPSLVAAMTATSLFEQSLKILDASATPSARQALATGHRLRGNDELATTLHHRIEANIDQQSPRERAETQLWMWVHPEMKDFIAPGRIFEEHMVRRTKVSDRLRAMQRG